MTGLIIRTVTTIFFLGAGGYLYWTGDASTVEVLIMCAALCAMNLGSVDYDQKPT